MCLACHDLGNVKAIIVMTLIRLHASLSSLITTCHLVVPKMLLMCVNSLHCACMPSKIKKRRTFLVDFAAFFSRQILPAPALFQDSGKAWSVAVTGCTTQVAPTFGDAPGVLRDSRAKAMPPPALHTSGPPSSPNGATVTMVFCVPAQYKVTCYVAAHCNYVLTLPMGAVEGFYSWIGK